MVKQLVGIEKGTVRILAQFLQIVIPFLYFYDEKFDLLPGLRTSFNQENIPSTLLASFSSAYLTAAVDTKINLVLSNVIEN